jgi:hypothetical protein
VCPDLVIRKRCLNELDRLPMVFNDCHLEVLYWFIWPKQERFAGDSSLQVDYFEGHMGLRLKDWI